MSSVINSGIRMRTAVAAAACIGFATTGGAIAGDDPAVWQDHAAIRAAVARAVQADLARGDARIAVTVDEIDERLHLARCEQPLTVGIPPGRRSSTRVAAEVRCPGPRAWKLYVPVRVVVHQHVVVAARALGRGSVLADGDILLAERETNALPYGYLLSAEHAVGNRLRRDVRAGKPVTPGMLETPALVKRGQQVTLEARSGGMVVRMAGVAKADGIKGEVIAVENSNSQRVVHAVVRTSRTAEVLLR